MYMKVALPAEEQTTDERLPHDNPANELPTNDPASLRSRKPAV
jgi:hypothetical protein